MPSTEPGSRDTKVIRGPLKGLHSSGITCTDQAPGYGLESACKEMEQWLEFGRKVFWKLSGRVMERSLEQAVSSLQKQRLGSGGQQLDQLDL